MAPGDTTAAPSIDFTHDGQQPTHAAATEKRNRVERFSSDDSNPKETKKLAVDQASVTVVSNDDDVEDVEGQAKFHRLSWQKLTICLIVEAIALGSLSMPNTFAKLGLVPGILITVFMGLVAIYTSWLVGQVCIKYKVQHYDGIGRLLGARVGFPRLGREIMSIMFVVQLLLTTGSHVYTGTRLWEALASPVTVCAVGLSVASAALLYVLALPPTFHDIAILGYVDFISILVAILLTMVGVGLDARKTPGPSDWKAFPDLISFADAFLSITNIVFAYSFTVVMPSIMGELKRPDDYIKSIWTLGITEIIIYTGTGAIIYVLGGSGIQSPALLSAGSLTKAAWGVAIPVVFISGSINTQVAARYVHGRVLAGTKHRFINTYKGWSWWLALVGVGTILAWAVAEAVPFFSDLLGLTSSLMVSGFSFYWPGLAWWLLLKPSGASAWSKRSTWLNAFGATVSIAIGLLLLGAGMYSTVVDIKAEYAAGTVGSPFSCRSTSA